MGDPKLSKVEKFAAKLRGIKKNSEQNAASGNRMFEGPHFDFTNQLKSYVELRYHAHALDPVKSLPQKKD